MAISRLGSVMFMMITAANITITCKNGHQIQNKISVKATVEAEISDESLESNSKIKQINRIGCGFASVFTFSFSYSLLCYFLPISFRPESHIALFWFDVPRTQLYTYWYINKLFLHHYFLHHYFLSCPSGTCFNVKPIPCPFQNHLSAPTWMEYMHRPV